MTQRNWSRMARGLFVANGGRENVLLYVGGSRGEWIYKAHLHGAGGKVLAEGTATTKLAAMLAAETAVAS